MTHRRATSEACVGDAGGGSGVEALTARGRFPKLLHGQGGGEAGRAQEPGVVLPPPSDVAGDEGLAKDVVDRTDAERAERPRGAELSDRAPGEPPMTSTELSRSTERMESRVSQPS